MNEKKQRKELEYRHHKFLIEKGCKKEHLIKLLKENLIQEDKIEMAQETENLHCLKISHLSLS